jgi:mono/diheme cytochrome c family protein
MRRERRGLCACGCLLLAAVCALARATAGEESTQLKAAPGRELTAGRCAICHSLQYIPENAPAMNSAVWQKTVQKMRERFGAPITDEEAQQILAYLGASYSGKAP